MNISSLPTFWRTAVLCAVIASAITISNAHGNDTAQAECGTAGYSVSNSGYVDAAYTLEDRVRNYDFVCNPGGTPAESWFSSHTDWPVTIVFINNANVVNVYADLKRLGFTGGGQHEYGRILDNATQNPANTCSGWCWGSSKGRKTPCSPNTHTHVRFYAPGSVDRSEMGTLHYNALYNTTWGYYVPATTHLDIGGSECPPYPFGTGYAEQSSFNVYAAWNNAYGSNYAWYNSPTDAHNANGGCVGATCFINDPQVTWLNEPQAWGYDNGA